MLLTWIINLPKRFSFFIIHLYRFLFCWTPPVCRFNPSCSQYSLEAIKKYGFIIGWKLSIKRILSCHPFSKGGDDPVP
ncbi:MAG: membrane protein insertion efficiency factor YidD [Candidatus Caenarcaniphilales bacterium]|nr:membrane protein insertion efficiency factor YidD [Candidatus Caenarcaniphilales bacterium]